MQRNKKTFNMSAIPKKAQTTLNNPLLDEREEQIRKGESDHRRQVHSADIKATKRRMSSHSDESDNESIKEGFFWANLDTTWTVLDQKRLVSMDYLYHRSLEFHNNHHTFRATGDFDYTKQLDPMLSNAVACEILKFHKDLPRTRAQVVTASGLHKVLGSLEIPEGGMTWFNVKDLRALEPIAKFLNMHNIARSHFYDLRVHSAICGLDKGLFVSFCTVLLRGDDAEMHKVYTLSGPNYLVTFERELIIEPDDDDDSISSAARVLAAEQKAISSKSGSLSTTTSQTNGFEKKKSEAPEYNPPTDPVQPTEGPNSLNRSLSFILNDEGQSVLGNVRDKISDEIYERVCRMGPFYLTYEIGTEVLTTSDTLIEFISRTIFYLKQQVHRRISYRQKLHFHRKIGILSAVLTMCDRLVDEIHMNLQSVMNTTSSQFKSLNETLNWEHVMYISCLVDSHVFKSTCIERQRHDVLDMESAMSHVTAIRAEFTSTNLALIATVFLPMTFLAGVYGMNFERGGNFTDPLLNYKYGPQVFWGMCFVVVLINLVLFTQSGLVTWTNNEGILSTKPPSEEISRSSDYMSDIDNRSDRHSSIMGGGSFAGDYGEYSGRSIKEELRRQRITDLRRQSEFHHY